MDMNDLYHRRGEERLRAGVAACEPSRSAHLDLAERYGAMIHHARAARGGDAILRIAPRSQE
ncbi:MAG TPA: hypothetical protein VF702_04630 [Allosphingosinicella sp.]|jgi:hypothetical protein